MRTKLLIGAVIAAIAAIIFYEFYKSTAIAKAATSLSGTPVYVAGNPNQAPGIMFPSPANPSSNAIPVAGVGITSLPASQTGGLLGNYSGSYNPNLGLASLPGVDTTDLSVAGGALPLGNAPSSASLQTIVPPPGDSSGTFSDALGPDGGPDYDDSGMISLA